MNKPSEITPSEWEEILQVDEIREGWAIENETPAEFAAMVYGVKFRFHSGGPGYVGDLYIIQGDVLIGEPVSLIREHGVLRVA